MPNWKIEQPAPKELLQVIKSAFPEYLKKDANVIMRNENVGGPSLHKEGRALDIHFSISPALPTEEENVIAYRLFRLFIEEYSELGMDHVIWNRQQWSITNQKIRPYPDPDVKGWRSPHEDHIHIAWTREGSQYRYFPMVSMRIGLYAHLRKKTSTQLEQFQMR